MLGYVSVHQKSATLHAHNCYDKALELNWPSYQNTSVTQTKLFVATCELKILKTLLVKRLNKKKCAELLKRKKNKAFPEGEKKNT